jgi:hypothetical protein
MRKTWRPVGLLLSVCLALSASGCFTAQQYAAESGALILPGMSMEEVRGELGHPNLVIRGEPGTETDWIYRYEGGPSVAATVFLIVFFVILIVFLVASRSGGGGIGGGGVSDGPPYQIRIHFDPQGRVADVSPPHPVP